MTWSEWGEGEGEMAVWGWFKSMGRGRRDIGVGKELFAGSLGVLGGKLTYPTLVLFFISPELLRLNVLP